MKQEELKRILLSIESELLSITPNNPVYFHQQEKQTKHMAFMGIEGESLWISPRLDGFSIGLSGKSLEKRMTGFMSELFGSEPYGYKQKNARIGKQDLPFWITQDINALKTAIYYYSGVVESKSEFNEYPDEEIENGDLFEGALKKIFVNAYERNSRARKACIDHYGHTCQVCGFDFSSMYGNIGLDYIQVHHIVPIAEIGEKYKIDPIKDLIPVCANCHVMLHRATDVMSVEELSKIIEQNMYNK